MKKKIFLLLFTMLAMFAVCVVAFAEGENITVSYYSEGELRESVSATSGGEVALRSEKYHADVDGKEFFGWFSDDGTLYEAGGTYTFTSDTKLYEAYGNTVNTWNEFAQSAKEKWNYTRLGADIASSSSGTALQFGDNAVAVIDPCGHTINVSAVDDLFGGKCLALMLVGNGNIVYTTKDGGTGSSVYSNRFATSANSRFVIGRGVTIRTNSGIIENYQGGKYTGYPICDVYGTVVSARAVSVERSGGAHPVAFNIHNGASVTFSESVSFVGDGAGNDEIATLNLLGGTLIAPRGAEFFYNPERFTANIESGFMSEHFDSLLTTKQKLIPTDRDGIYEIKYAPCTSSDGEHDYFVTGYTVSCESAGVISYKCRTCGGIYDEPHSALGHNFYVTRGQKESATEEKTEAGYYLYICTNCGYERREYFYPSPSEVYVSVKVRYEKDGETVEDVVRVRSQDMFTYRGTVLTAYSFSELTKIKCSDGEKRNFDMSDVYGIEIPLGTTEIMGRVQNKVPYGVFMYDEYLEEVTFPISMEVIKEYAFFGAKKLKTVNGMENVTEKIGDHAFDKNGERITLNFDTLKLSANTIGEYAFYNSKMRKIYFASTVKSIGKGAFGVSKLQYIANLKEILIEKNTTEKLDGGNGTTVGDLQLRFGIFNYYDSVEQNLFVAPKVYYGCEYEERIIPPTCTERGYLYHRCTHCGDEYNDTFTDTIPHNFERAESRDKASTCTEQGYEAYVCSMCKYENRNPIPLDPDNHDFSYSVEYVNAKGETVAPCSEKHIALGICACGEREDKTKLKEQEPFGHRYTVFMTEKASNCGVAGYKRYKCEFCDEYRDDPLPLVGKHRIGSKDEVKSVAPTCKTEGKDVYCCTVCGEIVREIAVKTNPDSHVWDNGTVTKEATSSSQGRVLYTCTLCGETKTVFIPRTHTEKMPAWAIVLIVVGGVAVLAGVGFTVYLTLFRKKNASRNYKYKFNTLGKK